MGRTLTANLGDIMDANGLPATTFPAGYTFQWVRGTDTDISGATSQTYQLAAADSGNTVKVEVSFTDGAGHSETLTSDPTGTVAAANACLAPDFGTRRNIWTGTVTLADFEYISQDVRGFDGSNGSISPSPATVTIGANTYTISSILAFRPGASRARQFVMTVDSLFATEEANALRLHACDRFVDISDLNSQDGRPAPHYRTGNSTLHWVFDWTGISTRTFYLSLPANNAATGKPTISGTVHVGQTLTANLGNIADTDGLPDTFPDDYAFQWVRFDADGMSNRTVITGATNRTYTLDHADAGKTVKVEVSFTDDFGYSETRPSDASGTILAAPGAPQSFTATPGDTQVTLGWAPPGDTGGSAVTKYQYRHDEGSTIADSVTWNDVPDGSDTGSSTADETSFVVTSLTNGTEYAFEVRAVNAVGEGAKAGPRTATPVANNHLATGTPIITGTPGVRPGADRATRRHRRRRRLADDDVPSRLHLPVGARGQRRRNRYYRRHRPDLHPRQRRDGQHRPGQGELHRPPRQRRDAHQRGLSGQRVGDGPVPRAEPRYSQAFLDRQRDRGVGQRRDRGVSTVWVPDLGTSACCPRTISRSGQPTTQ